VKSKKKAGLTQKAEQWNLVVGGDGGKLLVELGH